MPFTKERQTSGASWLGARLLLFFLRLRVKDIMKSYYPTKPERVDDWLVNEMLRASYDPGVPMVLESIFSFNLSIPLNFLLEGIEEKVLIIQVTLDMQKRVNNLSLGSVRESDFLLVYLTFFPPFYVNFFTTRG